MRNLGSGTRPESLRDALRISPRNLVFSNVLAEYVAQVRRNTSTIDGYRFTL